MKKSLVWALLALSAMSACSLFVESEFTIPSGSKPPKWLKATDRTAGPIQMTVYTNGSVKIDVSDGQGRTIRTLSGRYSNEPIAAARAPSCFPQYFIVEVGGIKELFEQRRPGALVNTTHTFGGECLSAYVKSISQ